MRASCAVHARDTKNESCAQSGSSGVLGAARACLGAAEALEMAARACLGAAELLEIAARACLGAAEALGVAALAWCGLAGALEMAARACCEDTQCSNLRLK